MLLMAYALRAYGVGAQALRGDEGFAVNFVAQPLRNLLAAMAQTEPNPPLYWLILKGWMALAGSSELAVRWPSVLAGVAAVALVLRWGRALVGQGPALAGALLTAASPFLIWYSQDARAYSLVVALTLAAAWQTWEAAQQSAWPNWLAAGILWWLALFAHYFAVLPFVSTGLALILSPRTRKRWAPALAMGAGVGLAQLPWAIYVAPLMAGQTKSWIVPVGIWEAVWKCLMAFAAGTAATGATPAAAWVGGAVVGLLLIWAAVVLYRRNLTALIWLTALGLGGPLLLGVLSIFRPAFTEQYVISAWPGALLLAGIGLTSLPHGWRRPGLARWLGVGAAGVLASLALLSLLNATFNPRYAKSPNWRAVVSYLDDTARPSEVVAVNLPDPAFFLYYHGLMYRGPLQSGWMPVEAVPKAPMAQLGAEAATAQLEQLRDSYQHIRFFFSPSPSYDPDGFAGTWLANCCEKTSDIFVAGFRVQTFDTPSGSLAARQPYPVNFADGATLTGYRVISTEVAAGDTVHLTLFWSARAPVQGTYTVFVHLLAPDGFNLAGGDSPPVNGRRPTDGWQAGETIIDPHLVDVPADTPPSDYTLEIGLYVPATGQRLHIADSAGLATDAVHLPATIRVRTP